MKFFIEPYLKLIFPVPEIPAGKMKKSDFKLQTFLVPEIPVRNNLLQMVKKQTMSTKTQKNSCVTIVQ